MNKLLIVYLAVCLISVHAYVKRDAPATEKNYLDEFQKQVKDMADTIQSQVKNAIDPETIKKNFNQFVDETNKLLENAKKQ